MAKGYGVYEMSANMGIETFDTQGQTFRRANMVMHVCYQSLFFARTFGNKNCY